MEWQSFVYNRYHNKGLYLDQNYKVNEETVEKVLGLRAIDTDHSAITKTKKLPYQSILHQLRTNNYKKTLDVDLILN